MDNSLIELFLASLIGLCLSVLIERAMTPRPPLLRPWAAWALHGGLWLLIYALFVLLLGRPWFSAIGVNALLLVLVLVNNAKVHSLQEPFVFQDYEYFTDAIRHPRLYIPFLGWTKFVFAVLIFILVVGVLMWEEHAPDKRFDLVGQFGGVLVMLALSWILIFTGNRTRLLVLFRPKQDIVTLGFLSSLWRYAQEARHLPKQASPLGQVNVHNNLGTHPHLVAVQSESFFDPRSLCTAVRHDVLDQFDLLKAESIMHGKLRVPAWGANTVRTEFSFLTGINSDELGVHQFNPYRAIAAGWDVASIASFLKKLGYRTVCIHPYPATFYQRNKIYPKFGFDEFIDIQNFSEQQKVGPYVGDAAVTSKILEILNQSEAPVFVFAITMENHGPLHLEKVEPEDVSMGYQVLPPAGFEDMTIYLRHLRNANKMIGDLRQSLMACKQTVGLCWYGDHVPIMPTVYQSCGLPEGEVDFVFWHNRLVDRGLTQNLNSYELPMNWLKLMQLMNRH